VQMFVWEDASLKPQRDAELAAFFNVRHIYSARTGIYKGVLITANVTHDLFAIKKKIRSSVDGIFFRSLPTDDYDKRIARDILGEDNYNRFADIIRRRDSDPSLMGITYYNIRGEVGFVNWDLAKQDYVIDVDTLPSSKPRSPFGPNNEWAAFHRKALPYVMVASIIFFFVFLTLIVGLYISAH
jgi:hypothetical protein